MHAANTPGHKRTCIPRRLGVLGFVWHVLVADLCSCTRRPGLPPSFLSPTEHMHVLFGVGPRAFFLVSNALGVPLALAQRIIPDRGHGRMFLTGVFSGGGAPHIQHYCHSV
jgi:hypothetical protein